MRNNNVLTLAIVWCRSQSDISRLEAKIERLEANLAAKDRELATLTRTVCQISLISSLLSFSSIILLQCKMFG